MLHQILSWISLVLAAVFFCDLVGGLAIAEIDIGAYIVMAFIAINSIISVLILTSGTFQMVFQITVSLCIAGPSMRCLIPSHHILIE